MKLKEIKRQSKDNEELRKLVALKLGKMPNDDLKDEDFSKVEGISLNARLLNGSPSGIGLDAISLFHNVRRLKLSNYMITPRAVHALSDLEYLKHLEIFGAEFDKEISFEGLEQTIETLKFTNCLPITFFYPKIADIYLDRTDIDFSKIDLQIARRITITNGKITNIYDLTDFPDIEAVNFDGSTLFGKDEEKIDDIQVGNKTRYSHNSKVELIDDSRNSR